MSSMSSFIGHCIQVIVYGIGIMLVTIGLSFSLNYLQAYSIKNDAENFMLDMLAYGTKHNGFNDPENGGYTFQQTEQNMIRRHKLDGKIASISYSPSVGTQVRGRSGKIEISLKYQYPTLNPFDSKDNMTVSSTKVISDVVHGYVKQADKTKPHDSNRPWWLWDDERWDN